MGVHGSAPLTPRLNVSGECEMYNLKTSSGIRGCAVTVIAMNATARASQTTPSYGPTGIAPTAE